MKYLIDEDEPPAKMLKEDLTNGAVTVQLPGTSVPGSIHPGIPIITQIPGGGQVISHLPAGVAHTAMHAANPLLGG